MVSFPDPFNTNDELDAATINAVMQALYDFAAGELAVPDIQRAAMWHDESTVVAGNAIGHFGGSVIWRAAFKQDTPADADQFTNGCAVNSGTYTLTVAGRKTSASGILEIRVNGELVATIDLYNASSIDYEQDIGGIVIDVAGWVVIEGTINGKNASSSSYEALLTAFFLRQGSD